MDADGFNRAIPFRFGGLMGRFAASQTDKRNRPALMRPLPREKRGILPNGAKIRWKPIANINESLHQRIVSSMTVLRFPVITRLRQWSLASIRPLPRAAPRRRYANCASLDC